jgi:hypothetical protein
MGSTNEKRKLKSVPIISRKFVWSVTGGGNSKDSNSAKPSFGTKSQWKIAL